MVVFAVMLAILFSGLVLLVLGVDCGLLFGVVRVCMLGVWLLPLAEVCDLRVCSGTLVCG